MTFRANKICDKGYIKTELEHLTEVFERENGYPNKVVVQKIISKNKEVKTEKEELDIAKTISTTLLIPEVASWVTLLVLNSNHGNQLIPHKL